MTGGPWLRAALSALLILTATLVGATPATGAPPCTGPTCVHYLADITVAATVDPTVPVQGGVIHSYQVRVTNTGWRVGGIYAPQPAIGPASGPVYVELHQAPYELPMFFTNDSGVTFDCFLFTSNIVCHADSLPTNSTSQFTFYYQTPTTPGTYQFFIYANSYKWTEFDENNNTATLTYAVG